MEKVAFNLQTKGEQETTGQEAETQRVRLRRLQRKAVGAGSQGKPVALELGIPRRQQGGHKAGRQAGKQDESACMAQLQYLKKILMKEGVCFSPRLGRLTVRSDGPIGLVSDESSRWLIKWSGRKRGAPGSPQAACLFCYKATLIGSQGRHPNSLIQSNPFPRLQP